MSTIATYLGRDHNVTAANGSTWGSDWGIDHNFGEPNLNNNNKYTEYSVDHHKVHHKADNKKIYFRGGVILKKKNTLLGYTWLFYFIIFIILYTIALWP